MIFLTIHKISYYKVRVSTGIVETRWLGGSFLMFYRNNASRLGSSFISVCSETRWLGPKSGFYVPERPCRLRTQATTIPQYQVNKIFPGVARVNKVTPVSLGYPLSVFNKNSTLKRDIEK